MGIVCRWAAAGVLFCLAATPVLTADAPAGLDRLLARLQAVGKDGAGNAEARAAWRELVQCGPEALLPVLAAWDEANPIAGNWLRTAVDAIAERAVRAGHRLPARQLEALVRQTRHAGPARRLAYEWLTKADPSAPSRLLPGMLRDPSPELRRDAVALAVKQAQVVEDTGAKVTGYRRALDATLERDQADQIAKELKALGVEVDLASHFGFLRRWQLLGPFDNTGGAGFRRSFPPEQGVDLTRAYQGKRGMTLHWVLYASTDPYGVIDLNKALGKRRGAVAYAFAAVDSAVERPVQLRAGSENALQIFLNGRRIFARDEYHHGMRMDQHIAAGTLRAGRNEILVKVCQNEQTDEWAQAWSFQLRVTDAAGARIPVTVLDADKGGRPVDSGGSR